MALIFLPAADIPTFVGEGRVDLGITGADQVAEHEAHLPPSDDTTVRQVMDLGFGKCSLQVQVPGHGTITDPKQLVGRNIVTSFTRLAERYFADLESQMENGASGPQVNGDEAASTQTPKRLRTKIKYVGGSVEAACALGVADGVVDLVGMSFRSNHIPCGQAILLYTTTSKLLYNLDKPANHISRIRRNNESGRSQGHKYCSAVNGGSHRLETPIQQL